MDVSVYVYACVCMYVYMLYVMRVYVFRIRYFKDGAWQDGVRVRTRELVA